MNFNLHFTGYITILKKEIVRILRIWPQSLLPSAITMSLYFLIFGKIMGAKIGNSMGGIPYIDFITPGLIIMAILNNSYANVVSSFFGARFSRSIEELLVSPVSNHTIILGFISGGLFRGFLVAGGVCLVAVLFGSFHVYNITLFLLSLVFCGALFSLGGLLNAIFSQTFDDISLFPTFILMPLTYLGGVFYSISVLSDGWRTVALFNPLFYIVDLFRYACLGVSAVNPLISFSVIVCFTLILYFGILVLLNKGIRLKI